MTPNAIPPIDEPDDEATEQAPCPWCSGNGCGSCGGSGEVTVRCDGEPIDPEANWSPPDEDDYEEYRDGP